MESPQQFYDRQSPEWKAAFEAYCQAHRGELVKPAEAAIFHFKQALDQHQAEFDSLAQSDVGDEEVLHYLEGIFGGGGQAPTVGLGHPRSRPSQRYYLGRFPLPNRQKGEPEFTYAWEVLVFVQNDHIEHIQLVPLSRPVSEVMQVTSREAKQAVSI